MNTQIDISNSGQNVPGKLTPNSLVFWRHAVAIILILSAQNTKSSESIATYFGRWTATILITFVGSIIATSLIYLFFTKFAKTKFWAIFIFSSWIFSILQLFGPMGLLVIAISFANKTGASLGTEVAVGRVERM